MKLEISFIFLDVPRPYMVYSSYGTGDILLGDDYGRKQHFKFTSGFALENELF